MSNKKHIYILLGPEGAGKSTQAKLLATSLQLPYLATRKLIEDCAEHDKGDLGDACRKMFTENGYLAAELMEKLYIQALTKEIYKDGIIVDGALRTLNEVKQFNVILQESKLDLPVIVFYLALDERECIERLLYARKRNDDTIQGIKTRLGHYHEQLEERLMLIKQKYKFIEINGAQSKENVHQEILRKINVDGHSGLSVLTRERSGS